MEKIKNILEHNSVRISAALLIGGAALLGCGDESSKIPQSSDFNGVQIEQEVFENGTRVIRYTEDGDNFADVLQHCDGTDLAEQTDFLKIGYGAAGNAWSRSVDHPACADGKLTEADFKVQQ